MISNEILPERLKNSLQQYPLVFNELTKQDDYQNKGPFCCISPLDLGSDIVLCHRQELLHLIQQNQSHGIGSLLIVVNFVLEKMAMQRINYHQLQAYFYHWQHNLAKNASQGVDKDINTDCTFMIIKTFLKAFFTNTPQYLEILTYDDGYDQFYREREIEAAICNPPQNHFDEMQSSQFEVFVGETHSISVEDMKKSKSKHEGKTKGSVQQKPGLGNDSSQFIQPNGIQVIEESSMLQHLSKNNTKMELCKTNPPFV